MQMLAAAENRRGVVVSVRLLYSRRAGVFVQAMARWRSLAVIDVANMAWAFAKIQEAMDPQCAPRHTDNIWRWP